MSNDAFDYYNPTVKPPYDAFGGYFDRFVSDERNCTGQRPPIIWTAWTTKTVNLNPTNHLHFSYSDVSRGSFIGEFKPTVLFFIKTSPKPLSPPPRARFTFL